VQWLAVQSGDTVSDTEFSCRVRVEYSLLQCVQMGEGGAASVDSDPVSGQVHSPTSNHSLVQSFTSSPAGSLSHYVQRVQSLSVSRCMRIDLPVTTLTLCRVWYTLQHHTTVCGTVLHSEPSGMSERSVSRCVRADPPVYTLTSCRIRYSLSQCVQMHDGQPAGMHPDLMTSCQVHSLTVCPDA